MVPATCRLCTARSACCANNEITDISPPYDPCRSFPAGRRRRLSPCYVQAGQARLLPRLRPRAVDLLDRPFHGLGHTGFPLPHDRRVGPESIEGDALEFFMSLELGQYRTAAHDHHAAHDEVRRHDDQRDRALGQPSAEIARADEAVLEL